MGASGWTAASIQTLLDRLDDEGPVQAAAIRAAADNDGLVSREDVYELGDYDERRMLRGFTRPANRIAQELRDAEEVPESAVDVLEAVYDADSYAQATGFRIPAELVALISEQTPRDE